MEGHFFMKIKINLWAVFTFKDVNKQSQFYPYLEDFFASMNYHQPSKKLTFYAFALILCCQFMHYILFCKLGIAVLLLLCCQHSIEEQTCIWLSIQNLLYYSGNSTFGIRSSQYARRKKYPDITNIKNRTFNSLNFEFLQKKNLTLKIKSKTKTSICLIIVLLKLKRQSMILRLVF